MDLHLKCDALLLADRFEKFRNSCLKDYELFRCHYVSAPALSWDAMLSMTKVEPALISDAHMYLIFEKGMRSGVSNISKRYFKTNNNYLKSYEPKHESKYFIYYSANKVYG